MEHNRFILRQLDLGNEEALKLIFDRYYLPLVNHAESYLFDRDEAKDVVQNILVKVWEKAATISIQNSLENYLFGAVRNQCLNRLESLKIRDKHQLLFIEGSRSWLESGNGSNLELEKEVNIAISKLPQKIRQIIELKYAQSKKISEIATDLNISQNTVKTQLKRGRAKLKASLETIITFAIIFIQYF